ncbi:MAG TPA: PHB depolymerase family esterase [Fimbriimonadaceae bacterium]|nr:PHB depolymerase family esterase [Fimbriimonadaceae bacterium]HRJ96161.1 PHB depolymerase family esterase [Fimbriimonadaceae bacterium]
MMGRVLILGLALAAVTGCGMSRAASPDFAAARADRAKSRVSKDGISTLHLKSGGLDRSCRLYGLLDGTPRPMVILIHCSSDTPESIVKKTGFADLARREGFILAVPEVAAPGKGWTSHPKIFGKEAPADDIGFFRELLVRLKREFPIDPHRIYVAGHLSGAMMAFRLAADMTDQFAAVGTVNGTIGVTAQSTGMTSRLEKPALPIPVIAFHGWQNDVMPYDGGPAARAKREYVSVNETIRFWRSVNACTAQPLISRYGHRETVRILYPAVGTGADVILYKLPKHDHEWPTTVLDGEDGASRTPAELMWAFFSTHRR